LIEHYVIISETIKYEKYVMFVSVRIKVYEFEMYILSRFIASDFNGFRLFFFFLFFSCHVNDRWICMHLIVSWMQIIYVYFNNELKFLFADFKQLLFICDTEKQW